MAVNCGFNISIGYIFGKNEPTYFCKPWGKIFGKDFS